MADSKVLVNGRIYVSFKPLRTVEALSTLNGRVAYVGKKSDAMALAGTLGSEVVDLGGRTVIPGFVDSHVHLDGLGSALETLDLRGCGSIRQLKEELRSYVGERKEAGAVIGRG
ncbi:MAG: amidohydrolase family protein, partial [Candidatus Brockarchaeota archaeon]|nr:amidohydrolase family protein [Candidatus Brockarchaeota archaeon]